MIISNLGRVLTNKDSIKMIAAYTVGSLTGIYGAVKISEKILQS